MISLTDRTAKEDDLADWLEDHGFEDGYESAPVFVDFGFETNDLDKILDYVPEEHAPPVLEWMHNVLMTETLVNDIDTAAVRISDLVSSIKSYTHMDRGSDMEAMDIRVGLENTITMLNHKLKQKQIETSFHIDDNLPQIKGRTGSLNQVWTNIIDNAIDAMDPGGKLIITSNKEGDHLMVLHSRQWQGYSRGYSIKSL